ncbi:MAG: DUF1080 domain-containing protein, partial [Planctomycetes bacterium]|nr:DUF1080 domain-containing protein [Planctomycetota bacterium]
MNTYRTILSTALAFAAPLVAQEQAARPLWNGVDFAGWHGQRHVSPYELAAMDADARTKLRAEDDASMRAHWSIENGELVNDGEGAYLTTDVDHGDAEFSLEYRTVAKADSGVYLRGCPQVQIWDCTEAGGKWNLGADRGSGGLWNNEKHERFPARCADKPFGEWNRLVITNLGARVWVTLNGVLVTDGVVMENYWDRARPLPRTGPLQLQTHGGEIRFRNLAVRAIGAAEANERLAARDSAGFAPIFDGRTFDGWRGDLGSYEIVNGEVRCRKGSGGVLFTDASYSDFVVRLAFRLPPAGNNGLAIRYPGEGDPAYTGFEVQVLDDSAPQYAAAKPWQYHGSVYGVVAAERGFLRPQGEWNVEEVTVRGSRVVVELNGTPIVDAD